MLNSSWAGIEDAADLAGFTCWDGESEEPWVAEAQNYVNNDILLHPDQVLIFRDEHERLVAVVAFDYSEVGIPLLAPTAYPGWHLQVVAVALEFQNQGLSQEVFNSMFETMRQMDVDRAFVTANVHGLHAVSLKACASAGLAKWIPIDDEYWTLLGEVPEA